MTIPYAPQSDAIAELLLRSGQQQAEAQARQGQLIGSTISNLGGQVGGYLQQRAEQDKITKRDAATLDLFGKPDATLQDYVRVGGPDYAKIYEGVQAHKLLQQTNDQKTAQEAFTVSLKAWPGLSPTLKAATYGSLRDQAPKTGWFKSDMLPPEYNPDTAATIDPAVDNLLKAVSPQSKAQEGFTLSPGQERFDAAGKSIAAAAAAPVKPESRSIDEQMASAKLSGDTATYNSLLQVKQQVGAAGRDPAVAGTRDSARTDRSYNARVQELDQLRKPVLDTVDRLNGLNEMLDTKSPESDKLLAPKLLTVLVGGSGSGVRINNAEIQNITHGRSSLEDAKAVIGKMTTGQTITDSQRADMRALATLAQERISGKVKALNDARAALDSADTPEEHRKVMTGLQSALTDIKPLASAKTAPEMVKVGGKTVPFKSLSPADQQEVLASLP